MIPTDFRLCGPSLMKRKLKGNFAHIIEVGQAQLTQAGIFPGSFLFSFFGGGGGVRFGFNELAEFAMVGTGREGNRLVQTSFATSTFFSDGKFWRIQMVTARFGLNIVDTNDEFMVRGLLRLHLWFFILSSPQRPVLLFLGYPHYK